MRAKKQLAIIPYNRRRRILARGFDALEIYDECGAIATTSRNSFSQSQARNINRKKNTARNTRISLSDALAHFRDTHSHMHDIAKNVNHTRAKKTLMKLRERDTRLKTTKDAKTEMTNIRDKSKYTR